MDGHSYSALELGLITIMPTGTSVSHVGITMVNLTTVELSHEVVKLAADLCR